MCFAAGSAQRCALLRRRPSHCLPLMLPASTKEAAQQREPPRHSFVRLCGGSLSPGRGAAALQGLSADEVLRGVQQHEVGVHRGVHQEGVLQPLGHALQGARQAQRGWVCAGVCTVCVCGEVVRCGL